MAGSRVKLHKSEKIRIFKTVVLPPYGCESCFLTLRQEHRLVVFENRVLRRKFSLKRDEEIGGR
jgi:hypothetical protein